MQVRRLIEYLKGSTELNRECARLIERSHKFSFNPGDVSTEILDGGDQYARQLMANEIFPMPFDSCLFEFGPRGLVEGDGGDDWMWVLAWRERIETAAAGWAVFFRSFVHFQITGSPMSISGVGQIFTDAGFDNSGENGHFRLVGFDNEYEAASKIGADRILSSPYLKRNFDVKFRRMGIDQEMIDRTMRLYKPEGREELIAWTVNMMEKAFCNLLSVLGVMSTSAGVTISTVLPSRTFINAKRIKKGKTPLEYEHKVVQIDPSLTRMPGLVALGGSHASPRIHWRRGHIRTLVDGKKVQVRPCIVGDVSRGKITHDYVVRGATFMEKPGI